MAKAKRIGIAAAVTLAVWWGSNAIYTGVKAASLPYNGPVEQYLSVEGTKRVAGAVAFERLMAAVDERTKAGTMPALELVHLCHDEVSRAFEASPGDGTGIENLLSKKTGICFDYCGATYALCLEVMRRRESLRPLSGDIRWARGAVSSGETLESSHAWLEARDESGEWRGYDAAIDLVGGKGERAEAGPFVRLTEMDPMLIRRRYWRLNWKRATVGGRVVTGLEWPSVLAAKKRIVPEAATRAGLPDWTRWPLELLVVAALFAAAWSALGRRRSVGDDPGASGR